MNVREAAKTRIRRSIEEAEASIRWLEDLRIQYLYDEIEDEDIENDMFEAQSTLNYLKTKLKELE